MTGPDTSSANGSANLTREAARWFARMRGPDAEAMRPALEAWLAQSRAHRSAYNRAGEIFAMGKWLAPDAPSEIRRPHRFALAALAAALVATATAGAWWASRPVNTEAASAIAMTAREARDFATVAGETRTVRLADGSRIDLAGDTVLHVRFGAARRMLSLDRGSARFEVAHAARPFIVLAGGGSVTARGTIFVVAVTPQQTIDVHLVQGVIDVKLPAATPTHAPPVRRLLAGDSLTFVQPSAGSALSVPTLDQPARTRAHDYRGVPLDDLIAEANAGARRPIRLADPSLGAQRVSGRFRIDDTALLADRLGVLFDSAPDDSDPRQIVLRRTDIKKIRSPAP